MQDMQEQIVLTLIYIFNSTHTRKYVNPFLEIQALLAPFTQQDSLEKTERMEKLSMATKALILLFRSYPGLLLLSCDMERV